MVHALDLLQRSAGFSDADNCSISVGPRLPASQSAWTFAVVFKSEPQDATFAVILAACAKVRAIRAGHFTRDILDVRDLDAALVNISGEAHLGDGSKLHAIEAVSVTLPWEISELDRQILLIFIEESGLHDSAFRSLRASLPPDIGRALPDLWSIDFSVLPQLARNAPQSPLLKTIQHEYSLRYPGRTSIPSLGKISDTLRKVGIDKTQFCRNPT